MIAPSQDRTFRSLRVFANEVTHHVLEWPPHPLTQPTDPRVPVRTVVLVHGFMDAAGTWDLLAPILAGEGFRVLAPDMRGFGEGVRAAPGSYYHFADYVFDLAEIVEALCPDEPVAVVGHSMGGTIATLFAGSFPERVALLALVEGVGPPDSEWEAGPSRMRGWIEQVRVSRARNRSAPTLTTEEALRRLAVNHPTVPSDVLAGRMRHLSTDVGEGRRSWKFDALHRTTSPTPFFAKMFAEFAKRVTCPVLFVSGGPLGYHPEDEAQRLAAFKDCTRVELSSAGHMVHWTFPDPLAQALCTQMLALKYDVEEPGRAAV